MSKNKPFVLQLVIVGGFLVFIYIFFALATSIYRDYKLEVNIEQFENEIERLADLAQQKPKDIEYYQSNEYKDRYAKESLNLLNPGERLIIIPQEDQIVKSEVVVDRFYHTQVLELPYRNQWWEYFFGRTLSLEIKDKQNNKSTEENWPPLLEERIEENYNVDEESLLEIEG
jgi:cell division protein FtsB